MKIKINKNGWLEIFRLSEWKYQYCPFTRTPLADDTSHCGDWCPLFGEIIQKENEPGFIQVCKTTLTSQEKIIDKRIKPEGEHCKFCGEKLSLVTSLNGIYFECKECGTNYE